MNKDVRVKVAVAEEDGHVWAKVEVDGACIRGDAENARQLAEDLLTAAADLEPARQTPAHTGEELIARRVEFPAGRGRFFLAHAHKSQVLVHALGRSSVQKRGGQKGAESA
jgi:hypothetical protein